MAGIQSYGGNAEFDTGQLALTGAAQLIPVPPLLSNASLQGAVLRITSGQSGVYFGNSSAVLATTGARIPANSVYIMTAVRQPVYVIGTNGDSISWCWEWN